MIELKELDTKGEQVLSNPTVGRAQKILRSRFGLWLIALISFIESALPLPLITDPFLIAGVLLDRKRALLIIMITIIASIVGGVFAFITALLFLEVLMQFLNPVMVREFNALVNSADTNTFVITIVGAITPIPYTLVAWVVAALKGSFIMFLIASIIGRSIRYGIVGYSVYRFGPAATRYARRYLGITSIFVFLVVGLLVWYKM
jgi:membrane protein YqaA with SNARE-associated domain